jgi:hypothetical protein
MLSFATPDKTASSASSISEKAKIKPTQKEDNPGKKAKILSLFKYTANFNQIIPEAKCM